MGDALQLKGTTNVPWNDVKVDGATAQSVHYGRDESGVGEVQVAVVTITGKPTKALMNELWKIRGVKSAMPVVVAAVAPEGVYIYSGGTDALPLGPLPHAQAALRLQAVLDEPDGLAAANRLRAVEDSYQTIGLGGFANHYLFASYHLKRDVPRRADWEAAGERAEPMLSRRGAELISSLGFTSEPAPGGALVLRGTTGQRRAIAVLLDESENFDQKSARHQLSPVAHGLELARREEVAWVVLLRQSTLRLYPGRDGVGVGQRGQSETYFELDLAMVDPDFAALLPLIFSAEALEPGGSADEILAGSGRYAADLGSRLRDRVYLGVVPRLSIAVAERLPQLGVTVDAEGLQVAYKLSMRILFRLLFQAYGEATELLPAGRNEHYNANSLRAFVERELTTDPADFAAEASSIWRDLVQVWDAIAHGNPRWEVPAYGGSLFDPTTDEGRLLERLQLPDSVLGPALQAMLTEQTEDGVPGAVDFRSLQVREFGTIYEGLLESSLSLAETDLTTDKNGVYIPALERAEPEVRAGEPYFHSASGERKATGSYYTPKIVVDHLIERSVEPALDAHLARVKALMDEGREREAGDLFFDFRVADLAMGSAHFLVAAVDKIERGMRDFLTATPVLSVRAELQRLAEKARDALGADAQAAEAITEAQLLRRQVARRCIYGLDINPLAVELSRLALWIHTFVPGLPMSSLDHGLVLANSLTGIGTVDEAMDALNAKALFEDLIREPLAAAHELLKDYARASEADKSEVARGAEVLAMATEAAAPASAIFDVALAKRLGLPVGEAWDAEQFIELAADPRIREAVDALSPAHMPYLFPEVFLRVNAGFDVLVGNPPWEKLHVEEHQWWGLRIPKLRSMPQKERTASLTAFRESRPDLERQYEAEIEAVSAINLAVSSGPYPGIGSAHLDLYQAFAWRFWRLLRSGGRTAVVLPRGALSGSGLQLWRRDVISGGSFADVCFLMNTGGWVFENVDGRYTVGLVVIERGAEHVVRFCGPFANAKSFRASAGDLSEVSGTDFLGWSSTAAFPLIPDPVSAEVFLHMKRSPRFDTADESWEFRPVQGDLNATGDKASFEVDVDEPRGRTPVLAGASFNIWEPGFGTPYAYAIPEVLRPKLAAKLARAVVNPRSAYFALKFVQGSLPLDRARIAFRDVTNQTNSRTTLACLIPPGSAVVHNAPFLVNRRGDEKAEAFLLGVMSSIPFDWGARRWVELHLTFEVLAALPVPRYMPGTAIADRIVQIAGRLAAVDERYTDWATEVGVTTGSVTDPVEKQALIAELDALVALSYDLTREQIEHVFATFHRGWNYDDRLAAVLEHYDKWKDAA
ncbi:MAG: hypothetical protein RJQ01_04470 [Microcella sp.]|uniref:Eco57I restriction-modification methylase domain-containing protein n=1 Tax=Microcella sp. TaxID=1913979 RepID=UPI003315B636